MLRSLSVASGDSNWNTPAVPPARSMRKRRRVLERQRIADRAPSRSRARIDSTASSMTVSVVRPRKSIFSIPAFSSAFMSYWVTTMRLVAVRRADPCALWVQIGTYSSSGPGAITTPAACTPVWRDRPSSAIA